MVLVYILIVSGMALAGLRMLQLLVLFINVPQFTQVVRKLLAADNLDRAFKLCNAVPKAPFPRTVKQLLERAKKHDSASAAPMRADLKELLDTEYQQLNKYAWLGSLGVLLAAAGAGLSLSEPNAPLFVLFGAVVAVVLTFNASRKAKAHREQAERCGEEIIDTYLEHAAGNGN